MTFFDLSHPITTGLPVYPGDPAVSVAPALSLADDGAAVSYLQFGSHTGTHLDAPSHAVAGGRTVDRLDLDHLHGEAYILHVRETEMSSLAARTIQREDLAHLPERLPSIVCIATGWDRYFHDSLREHHPCIDPSLTRELWARDARVLGVDTLSPDPTAGNTGQFPVHDFWLGNEGVIVENLQGLTALPDRVEMSMLPLKLVGVDGSPVRAVAWDRENTAAPDQKTDQGLH